MKYRNQQDAKKGDTLLGFTKSGQPIAGQVLDLDPSAGKVLVSPAIQSSIWLEAPDCVPVSREIVLGRGPSESRRADPPAPQREAAPEPPPQPAEPEPEASKAE